MRIYVRLTNCEGGNCPAVDQWTDTGDFRVKGYKVAPEDKPNTPVTEDVVTVPRSVLLKLIPRLLFQQLRQLQRHFV